ncbi:MAG: DUF2461 domain-containing protein [Acidobacteriota bacterium]
MHEFKGFPPQALDFYAQLRQNNRKEWFDQRRSDFEEYSLEPARAFVEAMGQRLSLLVPHIHADPRVNRSLFRIYRDTRFSKDKTPFKTHLAIWLWEGRRKRMECSGFYFHLEPDRVMAGTGIYAFPNPHLKVYRQAVGRDDAGEELSGIARQLRDQGYSLAGKKMYKRLPQGFSADHPRADLLLYGGLYSYTESKPFKALHSDKLLDWCFEHYHAMLLLHRWLHSQVVERAGG